MWERRDGKRRETLILSLTLLSDMLREGLYDVAAQLANEVNISDLVDVDLFTQSKLIIVR